MKYIYVLLAILVGLCVQSCEVTDFDLQENPNELTPDRVNPDYLLNEIQILFVEAMHSISITSDDIMRYENMSDTYADIAEPSALNGEWDDVYAMRSDVKILESIAEGNPLLDFHVGMSKILHAYAFATMVDYLGDIPFSQANLASETFNPSLDDDAEIYARLLDDLDSAIILLQSASVKPLDDLFYNGDAGKWITLANSIKFKMYVNTRNANQINNLIQQNDFISSSDEDFIFRYSSSTTPESRHPYFSDAYVTGGTSRYIGNYFMWLLRDSKSIVDPRLRYYVFRQTNDDPPTGFLKCLDDPIFHYCYLGDGYWGRDHGDDDTRPNDRELKTIYGIYPAGGAFDANNPTSGSSSNHLGGAGIFPMLTSAHIDFLKAEAALIVTGASDADILLESAIRKSFAHVTSFGSVDSEFAVSQSDFDRYIDIIKTEFFVASTTEAKLDIVIRELYLATFGNSIEAYNAYRRTGYPSNIELPIKNGNVPFPRTFSLAKDAVDRNSSLNQRPITNKVFWDTNPDGFIK